MKIKYWGFFHRVSSDPSSSYGVWFPDFPGLVTGFCMSIEESGIKAQEGLDFHIEGLIRHKEPIPAPKKLSDIKNDLNNRGFFWDHPDAIPCYFRYDSDRIYISDDLII